MRGAVLLVHGFTGSPFEMRLVGEALYAQGYTVYGPRLAGHCDTAAALCATSFSDWVDSVEQAFEIFRPTVERLVVCGLSLGGLITLELARRRPAQIDAIAVLAAPLWLSRPVELAISLTRRLGRIPAVTLPKLAGSDVADPTMRARNNLAQGAIGLPIPAVLELRSFMDHVHQHAAEVRVPTLLMHSRRDHTAPYACMAELERLIGPGRTRAISLERSFHVITIDVERAQVIDAVVHHIEQHVGPRKPGPA